MKALICGLGPLAGVVWLAYEAGMALALAPAIGAAYSRLFRVLGFH